MIHHHHRHHLLNPCGDGTNLSGARAPSTEEGQEERGPQDVYGRGEGIVSKEMIKNIHPISGRHQAGIWEALLAKGSRVGAAPSTVLSVPATFLWLTHGQESLEREDRPTGTAGITGQGEGPKDDPAQPIALHRGEGAPLQRSPAALRLLRAFLSGRARRRWGWGG